MSLSNPGLLSQLCWRGWGWKPEESFGCHFSGNVNFGLLTQGLTGLKLHKKSSLAGQRVLVIPMSLPHQPVSLCQTLLNVNSEV